MMVSSPESGFSSAESKRAHELLIRYWNTLRGARAYPGEEEIDPEVLGEMWDSCFLVTLMGTDEHDSGFKYEYVGRNLLEAYGQDMTGLAADDEDAPQIASMLHALQRVADGKPVLDEAVFVNGKYMEIRYRCCLLPLGHDGAVEYALGCMRWKYC